MPRREFPAGLRTVPGAGGGHRPAREHARGRLRTRHPAVAAACPRGISPGDRAPHRVLAGTRHRPGAGTLDRDGLRADSAPLGQEDLSPGHAAPPLRRGAPGTAGSLDDRRGRRADAERRGHGDGAGRESVARRRLRRRHWRGAGGTLALGVHPGTRPPTVVSPPPGVRVAPGARQPLPARQPDGVGGALARDSARSCSRRSCWCSTTCSGRCGWTGVRSAPT